MFKIATVSGIALDGTGTPLVGVEIVATASIVNWDRPQDSSNQVPTSYTVIQYTTKTDKDGSFTFDKLPSRMEISLWLHRDIDAKAPSSFLERLMLTPGEERPAKAYRIKNNQDLK